MNTPYDQIATVWWDSLNAGERERWLDAAASIGRERTPMEAYAIRTDIERGVPTLCVWRTQAGTCTGRIVSDGRVVYQIGSYATEAEVHEIARLRGFDGLPVLRVQYLADVPGFGIEE
jgi:hypothetical protein